MIKDDNKKIELSSQKIMIAAGGESSFPNFEGNNYMINSDKALDLLELPGTIAIYGSGYIAVEFAGIFNGFGVNTHLIFRADMALRGFDKDIRQHLMTSMEQKGITIHNPNAVYYIPDYLNIVQEFILQTEDQIPEYPRITKFLNYWDKNIDGPIKEVYIYDQGQSNIRRVDRRFKIN